MFCAINCVYIHGIHVSAPLRTLSQKYLVSQLNQKLGEVFHPKFFTYTYLGTMQFEQTMYSASSVYGF